MKLVDPKSITIPEDRQRSNADPKDLIESIRRHGIIHPIVVDKDLTLIAGERRLRAALELGLSEVPVRIYEDLDQVDRQLIELEENVRRKDIPWPDQVRALRRIWELKGRPDHETLAKEIGWSRGAVNKRLFVAEALDEKPELANIEKLNTAYKKVSRERKRQEAAFIQQAIAPVEADSRVSLHHMRFEEWLEQNDELFNFIHVDFPYGVGMHASGRNATYNPTIYEDTPDIFFSLLDTFIKHEASFIAPDANIMFWCSMNHYIETVQRFEAAGFTVIRTPLIWAYGSNVGLFPDTDRRPRRTYETCLYIRKGDLPIVNMKTDHYVLNPQTVDREHPSEKPEEMLSYFMSMFVDSNSTVFDPTCGSGSALRVALDLGASRVVGVEMDGKYYQIAKRRLGV